MNVFLPKYHSVLLVTLGSFINKACWLTVLPPSTQSFSVLLCMHVEMMQEKHAIYIGMQRLSIRYSVSAEYLTTWYYSGSVK